MSISAAHPQHCHSEKSCCAGQVCSSAILLLLVLCHVQSTAIVFIGHQHGAVPTTDLLLNRVQITQLQNTPICTAELRRITEPHDTRGCGEQLASLPTMMTVHGQEHPTYTHSCLNIRRRPSTRVVAHSFTHSFTHSERAKTISAILSISALMYPQHCNYNYSCCAGQVHSSTVLFCRAVPGAQHAHSTAGGGLCTPHAASLCPRVRYSTYEHAITPHKIGLFHTPAQAYARHALCWCRVQTPAPTVA